FGDRELRAAAYQRAPDHLLHRHVALAEHHRAEPGAYALGKHLDALLGTLRLVLDAQPDRDHREARAIADPRLFRTNEPADHLVHVRPAHAESLEGARDAPLGRAAQLADPRGDVIVEHRLHLARSPGHPREVADEPLPPGADRELALARDAISRRRAERVL